MEESKIKKFLSLNLSLSILSSTPRPPHFELANSFKNMCPKRYKSMLITAKYEQETLRSRIRDQNKTYHFGEKNLKQ